MHDRLKLAEQIAVRMICALALLFVGFAHKVPAIAPSSAAPTELALYALPDGTLPTLCVTDTGDGTGRSGKIARASDCEACRIGSAILLPAPADQAGSAIGFTLVAELPVRTESFSRRLFPPNTGPRAPPSVFDQA